MKKTFILLSILTSFVASAQSIEISPNGGTTNSSAILDLKSTTKGFLLPRMTGDQMRAIPSPAQGLLVFCTDCVLNGDYYFRKGSAWVALGSTTATGFTTVGDVGANATANGATITNGVLSLAPADATNPGIVTTTAQTIAGAKTFSSDINVNGLTIGKGAAGISNNTAIGVNALYSNTTGEGNTANGSEALLQTTTGSNNTANGRFTLYSNTTGSYNTANGRTALYSNTEGDGNTANGISTLYNNTTGSQNTANGGTALETNTTGFKNTAIGYGADVASGNLENATAVGAGAKVNANNKIQLGNGDVTAVQLGTATNVTLETGLVKITGGTPGAGKVLTSDAAGLASWTTPSSSGVGVDLTTDQTIAGVKTFSGNIIGNAQLGIGTSNPNTTAALEVTSTTKGFLPPRLSSVQRNDMVNPTEGLVIYNSTSHCLEVYRGAGWFNLCDNIFVGRPLNVLLGGSSLDQASHIQQTSDGGYIISGSSSSSANGDVSGTNHGGSDYWIVKLDALGNIVWNKLLGGSSDERASNIQQTSDGGYIISGYSGSSANGDVSGTNHGDGDYWIVKLDALGNIVWNKLLGGSSLDQASHIQQTSDGGYIISGYSRSSANGDVSGTNHGETDYWIVKLDALGNIIWNKLLGGSGYEDASNVQQTTDGGYIISGTSFFSANVDVSGTNHGDSDYWIVTLDALGNIY
jgi:hypothetical protein